MEAFKLLGLQKELRANSFFAPQRQLFARSERVKGIDVHPTEPWILTTVRATVEPEISLSDNDSSTMDTHISGASRYLFPSTLN